jgi:hypothetical protein
MPGQGMFFGLGVNIKFPSNFRESPFTLIASGLTTLPQRLKFPFSLIRPGDPQLVGVPPRLNEIVPGWNYAKNAYALDRNAYKYCIRGKGLVPSSFCSIYNSEIARLVFDAYNRLQVGKVKDVYTKNDIDGLGENFMRERVRQEAIKTYSEYLERYIFDLMLALVEGDESLSKQSPRELRKLIGDTNKEIARVVALPETMDDLVKRYRQLDKEWFDNVSHGLDRDNERGRQIFDDYDDAHPADKGFLEWEKSRYEESTKRLSTFAKNLA